MTAVILIVREMDKWLTSRTKRVEIWADVPRVDPQIDDVDELANQLKGYSEGETRSTSLAKQRIHDAIMDRISLRLNLERDVLDRLLRDQAFLHRTLGEYPLVLRHFSQDWLNSEQSTNLGRKGSGEKDSRDALFKEIRGLLDSIERWEKEYEHSGSL